jgi:hypothetical protein
VRKLLTVALVATPADPLVIQGVERARRSRMSELRDRYLVKPRADRAR